MKTYNNNRKVKISEQNARVRGIEVTSIEVESDTHDQDKAYGEAIKEQMRDVFKAIAPDKDFL